MNRTNYGFNDAIYPNTISHLFSQARSPIWSSIIRQIWNGDTGSWISVGICALASILSKYTCNELRP